MPNRDDPPFEPEICDVCGSPLEDCICQPCPLCETIGDPSCYAEHGMELTLAQRQRIRENLAAIRPHSTLVPLSDLRMALNRHATLICGTIYGCGLGFSPWTAYRNRNWPPSL